MRTAEVIRQTNTMPAPGKSRNYGQWKVLLICPSQSLGAELAPLLGEHLPYSRIIELKEYPTRVLLTEALESEAVNLCFVDADSNRDWALALITDLTGLNPKLPIVALHSSNDSNYILRALRAGATEFLYHPLGKDQFRTVMERIVAKHKNSGPDAGKVCVVMPAKGDCGASTIAINLAHCWKKLRSARVLLMDLDPLTGTVAFQLKLKQNYSFLDALSRVGQLDGDVWRGMVNTVSGVDVMTAPEHPAHELGEGNTAAPLVEFARALYGAVIVDTSGPENEWPAGIAGHADELLLVTTNELSALHAAQRAILRLEKAGVEPSRVKVVVNRFEKDLGINQGLIESALNTKVFQVIPHDPESTKSALVEGKPVAGGTAAGRALNELAEKLAGKPAGGGTAGVNSRGGLLSFLRG